MKKLIVILFVVFIGGQQAIAQNSHGLKNNEIVKCENKNILIADNIGNSFGQESLEFNLIVNYQLSLQQMIADGKYDWYSEDFTEEHFPQVKKTGNDTIKCRLFYVADIIQGNTEGGKGIQKRIHEKMDKEGYRAATLAELLALGINYPELQLKFIIFAEGSIWKDIDGLVHGVPFLCSVYKDRHLRLDYQGLSLNENYAYLGVKK